MKTNIQLTLVTIFSFFIFSNNINGQQTSFGNTYISSSSYMSVFGAHNFDNAGGLTLPGIIATEREDTESIGKFMFIGNNISWTNATGDRHVDGYVEKTGSDAFTFPIGDNGKYMPIAVSSANNTIAAYFNADPNTAITSNVKGGNHSPLPSGAPFDTTLLEASLTGGAVSNVEYWDIKGSNATQITLVWNADSDMSTLTSNIIERLTIVGWDGTQWVLIDSTIDVNGLDTTNSGGVFGTVASNLTTGSITTNLAIVPDAYTIFTLGAALFCDLTDAGKTLEACNDNGSIADPTDDYISFRLNPTGDDLSTTYTVSVDGGGTISPTSGTYGVDATFQLQSGSADGTLYTITITDNTDPACQTSTTVQQSSCSDANDLGIIFVIADAIANGPENQDFFVRVRELYGNDTDGAVDIEVRIDRSPDLTFTYDNTLTTLDVGGLPESVNNADWLFDNTNLGFYIFRHTGPITANTTSGFGFTGLFDPGSSDGQISFSSRILAGSGGESNFENNIDAELIDFFEN